MRHRAYDDHMSKWLWGIPFVLLTACGTTPSPPNQNADADPFAGATLEVAPPSTEIHIRDGIQQSTVFTVTAKLADGTTRDVTSEAQFVVDQPVGSLTANSLAVSGATLGKATLTAAWKQYTGTASITVRRTDTRLPVGIPPEVPEYFVTGSQNVNPAPAIVYPPANVIVPRNLGDFEVHWQDAAQTFFEVTLKSDFATIITYATGDWTSFTSAEWTRIAGTGTTATVEVRSTRAPADPAQPAQISNVANLPLQMSNDTLQGGLYYWAAAATNGRYGIYRHNMAKPGEPPEEYMVKTPESRCVACHALSRDGTKMAYTYDGGNGDGGIVTDVATKTTVSNSGKWNFATYAPDNSVLVTVFSGSFTLRDGATGQVIKTLNTIDNTVTHPDFSPDGKALVYVDQTIGSDWAVSGGRIVVQPYDAVAQTLGEPRVLVENSVGNNFYPSWSPDGKWIVYNNAASQHSYNNAGATMWVVKADGTGQPIQLTTADVSAGFTNSWARWAPFASSFGPNSTPIFWLTVSSKRAFGNRLAAGRPQLWMFPFFADRAEAGQDPSGPAFRLPFQDLASNNHIAQWTEQFVNIE